MNYLFYDTETSGLDKKFDYPISFAARLFDSDFNLIDELDITTGLKAHVIPSIYALAKNGFKISDLRKSNLSFYQMTKQIHNFFEKHAPSYCVGYNSLKYDSELLRQSFFQNLLPPYIEQTMGNERGDLYPLSVAAAVFAPGSIKIGLNQKGRPNFKLESLAKENKIEQKQAHTASDDTLATAMLCKKIKTENFDFFADCMSTTSKQKINYFIQNNLAFCQAPFFDKRYIFASCCFIEKQGEHVLFNLSSDPSNYLDLSTKDLCKIVREKNSPFHILKNNRHALLFNLSYKKFVRTDLSDETILDRARQIKSNERFCEAVQVAVNLTAKKWPKGVEIEQKIYEGFPEDFDQLLMKKFHESSWTEKVQIAEQFQDRRWTELGHRIIFEENPSLLGRAAIEKIEQLIHRRLHENDDMPRSLHQAINQFEDFKLKNPGVHKSPLREYEQFLKAL